MTTSDPDQAAYIPYGAEDDPFYPVFAEFAEQHGIDQAWRPFWEARHAGVLRVTEHELEGFLIARVRGDVTEAAACAACVTPPPCIGQPPAWNAQTGEPDHRWLLARLGLGDAYADGTVPSPVVTYLAALFQQVFITKQAEAST